MQLHGDKEQNYKERQVPQQKISSNLNTITKENLEDLNFHVNNIENE